MNDRAARDASARAAYRTYHKGNGLPWERVPASTVELWHAVAEAARDVYVREFDATNEEGE
jgi:hypothetical protein